MASTGTRKRLKDDRRGSEAPTFIGHRETTVTLKALKRKARRRAVKARARSDR